MATQFRLLYISGPIIIGYDYDDVTMRMLTLPYLVAAVAPTPMRYDLGDGDGYINIIVSDNNKTNIPVAKRPLLTVTLGGKISGPYIMIASA